MSTLVFVVLAGLVVVAIIALACLTLLVALSPSDDWKFPGGLDGY